MVTMVSDSTELPFFPKYEVEHHYEDIVYVTWFETGFSQSHYNIHNTNRGSNACTLIALLMAAKCDKFNIILTDPVTALVQLFAISMLEGNRIHEVLKHRNQLKHINLNVPEAISYGGPDLKGIIEWKSMVFMEQLSKSLYENMKSNWKQWLREDPKRRHSNLYVVLVADSRTVLFVIQLKSKAVVLIDSHQHSPSKGAFMAFTHLSKLKYLCHWYSEVLYKFYSSSPHLYELSFLYFVRFNH